MTLVGLRDAGDRLPAAVVCLSPWADLALSGDSMRSRASADPAIDRATLRRWAGHYLAGGDPRQPLASPLYADLSGLPALLVLVGTAEILLDDAARVAHKAAAAGVEVVYEPSPQDTDGSFFSGLGFECSRVGFACAVGHNAGRAGPEDVGSVKAELVVSLADVDGVSFVEGALEQQVR